MSVVGRNKYGEEVKNKNKTSWCYYFMHSASICFDKCIWTANQTLAQDNIVPLFAVTLILMRNMTKEQYAHILSCQSTQFAQVNLKYIGVTWHKCSSLEASMGQYLAKSDN